MNRYEKFILPEYLDFIRTKPCVACGKRAPTDPDHLIARGWREGKRLDLFTLPLCRKCHSQRHQWGNQKFQEHWQLNLWEQVARLMAEYMKKEILGEAA